MSNNESNQTLKFFGFELFDLLVIGFHALIFLGVVTSST